MTLPPGLVRTTTTITTSAVANTVTTGNLVTPSQPTIRVRLWAWQVFPTNTAQAVVNWRISLRNASSTGSIGGYSSSNFTGSPMLWIPGGYALPANVVLDYSVQSALASLVLNLVLYTVEDQA